jgi:peptidyl-tRNA hydrolase
MVADYVLSKFKPNEKELIKSKEAQIFEFVRNFIGG